jgi:HAD superfamily hydrolase (TIGR01509 family)
MTKAIIFDCFGVLITDPLELMIAPLKSTQPDIVKQIVAVVTAANRGIIDTDTSRDSVATLLGVTPDEYVHRMKSLEVKNTELLDLIMELRQVYKTAMLSNVSKQGLEARFSLEDQAKYFDVVVASGVIGYAKPEAEAYGITADRLGVRLDECIMVDDREDYCEGARSVGMQAILYQSAPQLTGDLARLGLQLPQGKSVIMPA